MAKHPRQFRLQPPIVGLAILLVALFSLADAHAETVTASNRALFFQPSAQHPYGCRYVSELGRGVVVRLYGMPLEIGVLTRRISVRSRIRKLRRRVADSYSDSRRIMVRRRTMIRSEVLRLRALLRTCAQFDPADCSNTLLDDLEAGVDCGGACLTPCESPPSGTVTPTPSPESCLISESAVNQHTPRIRSEFDGQRLRLLQSGVMGGEVVRFDSESRPLTTATNLRTIIEVQSVRNGVNIVFNYTNQDRLAHELGQIQVAGFDLGRFIDLFDFRQGSETRARDLSLNGDGFNGHWWSGDSWNSASYSYPDELTSPVSVARNSEYTVGFSLLYPVLEYKQTVRMKFVRFSNKQRSGFLVHLDDALQPGESRSYTVALRIVDSSDEWIRTLLPYRNYFRENYGGVQYLRDPRPVLGQSAAAGHLISNENPFGYVGEDTFRPDIAGWGPWAHRIMGYRELGFERVMLWAASGLYQNTFNYPFLFMTPMRDRPVQRDSLSQLRRIPSAGIQMGYYQGYASRIHYDWSDPRPQTLKQGDPDHRVRAFEEFDMAVSLGAEFIGLDAFIHIPLWEQLQWTETLRERAPHVRFVGELTPSDLFVRTNASFVFQHYVTGPDILLDFILPGHEIWSAIRYDILYPDRVNLSDETVREVMRMVAYDGRVPLPYKRVHLPDPQSYVAAQSWRRTIPRDLQDPCVYGAR